MVTLCNRINFECESSPNTLRTILNELNKLRQTETLCDVKIDIGGKVFPCHRNILSSSCEYFRAMFGSTSFVESRNESVELQGIDPDVFEEILNFIYTGKVHITEENLSSLLVSGEYLGLHYLEDLCLTCIKEHIPMDNIGNLFRFAFETKKSNLVDTLCTHIAVNFIELSKYNELIDLSADALTRILTCPELQSSSSATTSFLLKWMNVRKDQESASNLLSMNTSVGHLLKMITGNGQAQEFIPEPKRKFVLANVPSNQSVLRFLTVERKRKLLKFLLPGTAHNNYRGGMHEIRPLIKMVSGFRSISNIHKTPIISMKSVVLNEEIMYIFYSDNETFVPNIWTKRPTMSGEALQKSPYQMPNMISLALVRSQIYFYSPEHFIGYECERGSWFARKTENNTHLVPVRYPSLVSWNDNIYVVGGSRPSENPTEANDSGDLLQQFDPRTGVFNRLPNSSFEHTNGAACVHDDKIYVVGGSSVSYYTNSKIVEIFEPVANKWRTLAPMPSGKEIFTLIPYKKHLYAIGGVIRKGMTITNFDLSTCVYDVESDKWLETISMSSRSTGGYKIVHILDAVVF